MARVYLRRRIMALSLLGLIVWELYGLHLRMVMS